MFYIAVYSAKIRMEFHRSEDRQYVYLAAVTHSA